MSLVASIDSLATRVGQECKGLRNDLGGKADAVHGTPPRRTPFHGLTAFPELEHRVEQVIPGQGDAGHENREQEGGLHGGFKQVGQNREGGQDGKEFVQNGLYDTTGSG